MNAYFGLPTCTYNVHISKRELFAFLVSGHLLIEPSVVPCKTGRLISKGLDFENIGERKVPNNLRFELDGGVADIEQTDWHVQYLTITIDKED